MTLLEALASLVILGASAVGFLGVFQNSARSMQSAEAWNRATAAADAALEVVVGDRVRDRDPGPGTRLEIRPWSASVDELIVQVTLPDGRTLDVHRLVRRR